MKYCSHCGTSVDEAAAFCSSCGKSLAASASAGGFWKGVAAAVVGVAVLVGILWTTMASNSADRRREEPVASAAENEPADDAHQAATDVGATPDVVVEEPGFVGKLLGEKPRVILTVSEGERLELELQTAISTETASAGDSFSAVLTKPILVEGREALPKGTEVTGHVAHAKRSDKVKGVAELTLELDRLVGPDGEEHLLQAEAIRFEAQSTKKEDAVKIGGASGVGALVGAVVGGKKGAAIGAGVGAGAGAGVVLTTRGDEVVLAQGTPLATALSSKLTVELVEDDVE